MDIDQQTHLLITAYKFLLLDGEKLNQKDKTELISVVIDYAKILIQKMGCDPYPYSPGDSLEERPFDPGICNDQPSKDIQNGDIE